MKSVLSKSRLKKFITVLLPARSGARPTGVFDKPQHVVLLAATPAYNRTVVAGRPLRMAAVWDGYRPMEVEVVRRASVENGSWMNEAGNREIPVPHRQTRGGFRRPWRRGPILGLRKYVRTTVCTERYRPSRTVQDLPSACFKSRSRECGSIGLWNQRS